MKAIYEPGDLIEQRYRIQYILGQGGVGITYAAEEISTGKQVALKVLSLKRMQDFKALELFEREAQILAQLNHSAIPRYLDYFQVTQYQENCFYLVQEIVAGKSLDILIEEGWQPNENEVKEIAIQVLGILEYLQELIPPVIHRDIKPENLILCDDGKVFLVDFGAVQDAYHNTVTGSSTVVGTYGYMAPEQFRGQAVLATDLYGLGTTLIYLLTQKFPSDLPQRHLKINFQSQVNIVERNFAKWLKRMIEPVAEDRFASASEALAVLQDKQPLKSTFSIKKLDFPTFSSIDYFNDADGLILKITPIWFRTNESLLLILFAILSSGVSYWFTFTIISTSNYIITAPILWVFPSLFGALAIWLLIFFIKSSTSQIHLEIERDKFRLQQWLFGWRYQYIRGNTFDISKFLLEPTEISFFPTPDREPNTICTFKIKRQKYRFGLFLCSAEKTWIVAEVNDFLQDY
jgi:eukaryotic-like serine/threonine-protein kinase